MNDETKKVSRRGFLRGAVTGAALLTAAPLAVTTSDAEADVGGSTSGNARERNARAVRKRAMETSFASGFPTQRSNGDERRYRYKHSYSKVLEHNALGEPTSRSYRAYLKAVSSGKFADWERIPLGGPKKFKNPLAGLSYELQSKDPFQYRTSPPPTFSSDETAAEMAELYWMALALDIDFNDYTGDNLLLTAGGDLTGMSGYKGPLDTNNVATPNVIFRGTSDGCKVGPYLSQFLLRDVPWGTFIWEQKQETVLPSIDFLTGYSTWLAAQNGFAPGSIQRDSTYRYIRNGRDLSNHVHIDRLPQPFWHAALIIQFRLVDGFEYQFGANAPFDSGNPYFGSETQSGFATFDYTHLLPLLGEVAARALRAAWFQKWFVHRRLRPEEFGGRVHNLLTGQATYNVHSSLLSSQVLNSIFSANGGTYLLPMTYPEGCPPHPAYPSGHAVVSGACATLLKAWFNEDYVITNPVVPNSDGTSLVTYTGSGASSMTLGGEIDKLAWNIAMGRSWAGVHWRSDLLAGILLGEQVAISMLQELRYTFREKFSFTFRRFNGRRIRIRN